MGGCAGFSDRTSQVELARAFHRLHEGPAPLVLVNVWDVASARIVEEAGFPAVATSSSAVAASLGLPDGERLRIEDVLAVVGRIARAVRVPVSADLEAGYAERRGDLADVVCRLIEAGAVGLNIEDVAGRAPLRLFDAAEAARRVETVRATAEGQGVPLFINARTDVLLGPTPDRAAALREVASRLAQYRDAGADCLFPLGVRDSDDIAQLVRELGHPVNVIVWPAGPSVPELAALGVRRVSMGSGPMRVVLEALRGFAVTARESGSYAALSGAMSNGDLQALVGR